MENSQGHGKSWKRMMMSWNFLSKCTKIFVSQYRVTTPPGKSWNLVGPFSRPGKSWKRMMMSWNFFVKMH